MGERTLRVHITGASGCGTTTLGRALAARSDATHLDTDDFFWEPTDPPYQNPRSPEDRLALLKARLDRHPSWVLSGSLTGWGDGFTERFDLVIFLTVPTEERLRRLRERERLEFGEAAVAEGGPMHEHYEAFLAWAASYDEGDLLIRSRAKHEAWLQTLRSPVLRLSGTDPVESLCDAVLDALG